MQLATWDCEVALLPRIVILGPPRSYQYHIRPAPSNLKPKGHPEYIKVKVVQESPLQHLKLKSQDSDIPLLQLEEQRER